MCTQVFTSEWSTERKTRHINGHFSDDENGLLSFE